MTGAPWSMQAVAGHTPPGEVGFTKMGGALGGKSAVNPIGLKFKHRPAKTLFAIVVDKNGKTSNKDPQFAFLKKCAEKTTSRRRPLKLRQKKRPRHPIELLTEKKKLGQSLFGC